MLHPPIQDFSIDGTVKKNTIVSVGRFFRGLYNDKRYVFLTEQFRTLCRSSLKGWEYHIIGSCSFDRDSSGLLNELRTVNQGFPVFFHVNESYDSMRMLVNKANLSTNFINLKTIFNNAFEAAPSQWNQTAMLVPSKTATPAES